MSTHRYTDGSSLIYLGLAGVYFSFPFSFVVVGLLRPMANGVRFGTVPQPSDCTGSGKWSIIYPSNLISGVTVPEEQNIFEALDVLRMWAIISWVRFDSCWLAGVRDMGYHPAMEVSMIWPWVSKTLLVPVSMTITRITMYESKRDEERKGRQAGYPHIARAFAHNRGGDVVG